MAKQIIDDEINLKRRARRRLVGAVVFFTVVVAVLPMLLDSEPKSVVKDIELRIPDKDKVGEFLPNAALPSAPAAVQPPSSHAPAIASPVAASQAVMAPQSAGAPQQAVSKPVAAPEQKPASSKPVEAMHKEQGQDAPQSGYIVQIGAFSNADTAHRWQKNLLSQGIKVYTEKAGDKIRVRVGPYATREAADKMRSKLESKGLHPNIVALE